MFGSALQPSTATQLGPRIVFTTPAGERHELGLQIAALTAMGAGAHCIYLGTELPVDEIVAAAERTQCAGVALSLVTIAKADADAFLARLRGALPAATQALRTSPARFARWSGEPAKRRLKTAGSRRARISA